MHKQTPMPQAEATVRPRGKPGPPKVQGLLHMHFPRCIMTHQAADQQFLVCGSGAAKYAKDQRRPCYDWLQDFQ